MIGRSYTKVTRFFQARPDSASVEYGLVVAMAGAVLLGTVMILLSQFL